MERQQGDMMSQTSATPREVTADVVESMRQGRFHLYPITHVDQGLELLTGVPAGDLMTAGTVHYLVNAQVHRLAMAMIAFNPDARHGIRPPSAEGSATE